MRGEKPKGIHLPGENMPHALILVLFIRLLKKFLDCTLARTPLGEGVCMSSWLPLYCYFICSSICWNDLAMGGGYSDNGSCRGSGNVAVGSILSNSCSSTTGGTGSLGWVGRVAAVTVVATVVSGQQVLLLVLPEVAVLAQ